MKMDQLCEHPRWRFVNGDLISISHPGNISVVETSRTGAGEVTFSASESCLKILPSDNRLPVLWFTGDECADSAFVEHRDGELHIHLVELKSRVNAGKWTSARQQFDGMLANVLAILGFFELQLPFSVGCYIALKSETITRSAQANPIYSKRLVGDPRAATMNRQSAREQFEQRRMNVLNYDSVHVHLIWRDAAGNANSDFV